MEEITFNDFKKLDIRVGKILKAERVEGTDKLYKVQVDIGKEKPVQTVTSLVDYYTQKELEGQTVIVLVNLKPVKMRGEWSECMLLAAETEDGSSCVLLNTEKEIKIGTPIT